MIAKLLTLGLLAFSPISPKPIPVPKPPVIAFKVGESEYDKSWENGKVTAYYDGHDRMNGETGITASGYNLDNGIYYNGYRILASDHSIPLGTLIDVKMQDGNVLHCVVLDRGGAIHGTHFDMVLNSLGDCQSFGVQNMKWQIVGKIGVN